MPNVTLSGGFIRGVKTISDWRDLGTPRVTLETLIREELVRLGFDPGDLLEPKGTTPTPTPTPDDGTIDFSETPNVLHSKVRRVRIEGKELKGLNWQTLVAQGALAVKKKSSLTGRELNRTVHINTKVGEVHTSGWKWDRRLGISIQNVDAITALKEVERLCREHEISLLVEFEWPDKGKALHPGKRGRLIVN